MSRFTGFSEKSFFLKKKSETWANYAMSSDAIALNFLKKLDSTDCSMQVLDRLDF